MKPTGLLVLYQEVSSFWCSLQHSTGFVMFEVSHFFLIPENYFKYQAEIGSFALGGE